MMTLCITTLRTMELDTAMLSVTNKLIMLSVSMLSVVMLNGIMLSVIMLNVIMLSVVMLNVIMLNVIMLNVMAPFQQHCLQNILVIPIKNIQKNYHHSCKKNFS